MKDMKAKSKLMIMLIMLLSIFFAFTGLANAENIRVYLATAGSTQTIHIYSGDYTVSGGSLGTHSFTAVEGDAIEVRRSGTVLTVYLNGEEQFSGSAIVNFRANINTETSEGEEPAPDTETQDYILKYGNKRYRGDMNIHPNNGFIVNILDLEYYLYAVVGREIGYSVPFEAQAAQAVTSRTYAKYNMSGTYYDVKNDTSSQVYGGYDSELDARKSTVVQAVDKTSGIIMYYDNAVINAVFSAHAGGVTANNENIWGNTPAPYLRSVDSSYDSYGKAYNSWTVTYTAAELAEKAQAYMTRIGQSGTFGEVVEVQLDYTDNSGSGNTPSGRVTKATIVGTHGSVSAKRDNIRTLLGLKSTKFEMEGAVSANAKNEVYVIDGSGNMRSAEPESLFAIGLDKIASALNKVTKITAISKSGKVVLNPQSSDSYTFVGSGWGHGVGLSQYGAMGMANAGYNYEEILRHYFGGLDPDKLEFRYIE